MAGIVGIGIGHWITALFALAVPLYAAAKAFEDFKKRRWGMLGLGVLIALVMGFVFVHFTHGLITGRPTPPS